MNKKTIKDIEVSGKKLLVRVDYNVSLREDFKVGDDFRIRQSLITIGYLLEKKCSVFIISHLGRPEGKRLRKYSLKPVAKRLRELLNKEICFFEGDYTKREAREELANFRQGSLVLLENLRFYPGEEKNSQDFAKKLSLLAEVFVNDAFGASHRRHASIVGISQFLPAVAGLLLQKEVDVISKALANPKRPLVAVVGGAKAEDKIPLIGKLLGEADCCLVGGGVVNAFLKAWGYSIGRSRVPAQMINLAKKLFWQASRKKTAMLLPTDVVLGNLKTGEGGRVAGVGEVPIDSQALDIGPQTQKEFRKIILQAKTIIWVGPMGVFEEKRFAKGTEVVYKAVAENRDSLSIVGGGDTMRALKRKHYLKTIDHISTGGGAMLDFIEKGTLPGLEALLDK